MPRYFLCLLLGVVILASRAATQHLSRSGLDQEQIVNRYCISCHNAATKSGGLVLQNIPIASGAHAGVWEKVIRKVRGGEMPPAGAPRPTAELTSSFVSSLMAKIDDAAAKNPYVGAPVVRRLNRTEYSHAVRDLLAVEIPFESELPPDAIAAGFNNIADALSISPVLLERYLKTAQKVSDLAMGTGDQDAVTTEYPAVAAQSSWIGPDAPFGTRGGVAARHYFPHDGEYELRAFIGSLRGNLMTPVEGVRFFQVRARVKAGLHTFVVTFPDEYAQREDVVPNLAGPGGAAAGGPSDLLNSAVKPTIDFLLDGKRVKLFEVQGPTPAEAVTGYEAGPPMLKKVEIKGPFGSTAVGETSSRKRILVCKPHNERSETACAEKILKGVATRAFRRDTNRTDLRPLMATFEKVRARYGFERGISAALTDILISPDFLFRLEFAPAGAKPGTVHRVSDFELASRLSFFLWSTIPDDVLLDAARKKTLGSAIGLRAQVERMLADPKAETLVANFATQWLGLRDPLVTKPDPLLYPEFDSGLKQDFEQEVRLFIRSVLRSDASILNLVNADYTYLNERLAKLYGVKGVTGPAFRRVSVTGNPYRGGLLGQGQVLLMTSHNNRTSPVLRGKWVLQNLFNAEPPPPPAGVPPLDETAATTQKLTTRQQVERHRANPVCSSCHARMDPLGFALENYDVIGRWRDTDSGGAIDSSGQLPNGETVRGLAGLREYFARHEAQFVEAAVERLMTFALGRELDPRDQPAVRRIAGNAKLGGYRFSDLVLGIINSPQVQMRQVQEAQ